MPNSTDEQFIAALRGISAAASGRQEPQIERVFRLAYGVLDPPRAVARADHGRASVEDATQNALREFLEKLRRGSVIPEQSPGLLRVIFWRRLLDERRRTARLRFGVDLDPAA